MHDFMGDLRVAARRLRHAPGFVLVAVVSLTMAIAANLVVFGVINAAVLRPHQRARHPTPNRPPPQAARHITQTSSN